MWREMEQKVVYLVYIVLRIFPFNVNLLSQIAPMLNFGPKEPVAFETPLALKPQTGLRKGLAVPCVRHDVTVPTPARLHNVICVSLDVCIVGSVRWTKT